MKIAWRPVRLKTSTATFPVTKSERYAGRSMTATVPTRVFDWQWKSCDGRIATNHTKLVPYVVTRFAIQIVRRFLNIYIFNVHVYMMYFQTRFLRIRLFFEFFYKVPDRYQFELCRQKTPVKVFNTFFGQRFYCSQRARSILFIFQIQCVQ